MSAERARFDSEELARVLSHYDLGIVTEAQPFERGSHESAKVVVTSERGRFLVKRRPKRDDPYKVAFSHAMQRFLASRHFPLPHLIGTRAHHNSMLQIRDHIYEVYEFIEGDRYDKSAQETTDAGRTLGVYHALVRDFIPKWSPPQGHYHNAAQVLDSFEPMCAAIERFGSTAGADAIRSIAEKVRDRYQAAAQCANDLNVDEWEDQIVHSDWHPGNLQFMRGTVVAVLDHDSARIRPRVMDIANGCLQFSMQIGGRDLSRWVREADVERATQFLRGYDAVNVITRAELKAIPALMQEALIAQAVRPILSTGTFAGFDGYEFLRIVLGKARWIDSRLSFEDLPMGTAARARG